MFNLFRNVCCLIFNVFVKILRKSIHFVNTAAGCDDNLIEVQLTDEFPKDPNIESTFLTKEIKNG